MTIKAETRVMQSQAQEYGSHQNLEEARNKFSPKASRGAKLSL